MQTVQSGARAVGLTTLRAVVGLVMAVHGYVKLSDFSAWKHALVGLGMPAPDVLGALSIIAELGGGILLALGLFTPIAAALVLVNMLVAIFAVHFPNGLLAKNNGFEY